MQDEIITSYQLIISISSYLYEYTQYPVDYTYNKIAQKCAPWGYVAWLKVFQTFEDFFLIKTKLKFKKRVKNAKNIKSQKIEEIWVTLSTLHQ